MVITAVLTFAAVILFNSFREY
ncbi:hypothetical protein [Sicyoidochytrium minutum DNA virus]|nr:hypothetical protein [Sicyoidochytrium minutum DNA virus]